MKQVGKNMKPVGKTPAIILTNPKYDHNVGAALRACSCFGLSQLWWTGNRVRLDGKKRLPREERMKGYKDVEMIQFDFPFDQFPQGSTPVAIELRDNSELLTDFEHPENPVYVFGPEDGSISSTMMRHCHRFVKIPIRHCANLGAAVYMVLYDRMLKQVMNGTPILELAEERGPMQSPFGETR